MTEDLFDLSAVDSQQLLDGLSDGVVVADDRGRVVYLNASAGDLLGWDRSRLIGMPLATIIPPRLRERHAAGFQRYLERRTPHVIGRGPVRMPALRADGVEVEVEIILTSQELGGRREVFVASLRDLSERLALERERALANYLLAMKEISTRLAGGTESGPDGDGGAPAEGASEDDVGPLILSVVGETLEWDVAGMWTLEGDVMRPRHHWSAPGYEDAAKDLEDRELRLAVGEGVPGRVAATGEAAWIVDLMRDPNFPRKEAAIRHGLRSCFAFPIVIHGQVTGVAEFCSAARRDAEPDLLPAMASAGAEIGRLIERNQARRQADQARQHLIGMAEALQSSLLPPHPPVIPGLELAARYRAAAGEGQVGGDFFDVFPLADGGWAVAIGDVSGRGPRAAALTALARYTLRAAAVASSRGSDVLRTLNDVVLQELAATDETGEAFLTVAFVVLRPSPEGLSISLACGGHPSPLLMRDTGEVEEATCAGELVGVFDAWEARDIELSLHAGDAIVLFTDGAIEGRGADGLFGVERLRNVLSTTGGMTAEEMATTLESAVLEHVGNQAQDDMAILVLRLPGHSERVGGRASAIAAIAPQPARA